VVHFPPATIEIVAEANHHSISDRPIAFHSRQFHGGKSQCDEFNMLQPFYLRP
jgi:hypothetical protein